MLLWSYSKADERSKLGLCTSKTRHMNFVQRKMVKFGAFMDRRCVHIHVLKLTYNASSTSGLQNFATGHSTTNEKMEKVP